MNIERPISVGEVQRGFPPKPETCLTAENWYRLPYLRWGLMNRSRIMRTTPVWRGKETVSQLPVADEQIGEDAFDTAQPLNFEARLEQLEIDGLLVLHRGRVIYETYRHGMRAETQHSSASISKSYIGILAAILEAQGVLDIRRKASFYVPALAGTALGRATLEQLMDMRAGIGRPNLEWRAKGIGQQDGGVFEAIGLLPDAPGSYRDLYEYMMSKPVSGVPGAEFFYDNGPAEAMGWVFKSATGETLADLMSAFVFEPIAGERDGLYVTDLTGCEFASGGLALTLRDMARLGEALRCDGFWNGRQIIPPAFINDIRQGGDPVMFAQSQFAAGMPNGSYRRHFFTLHDEFDGFMASGRSGQRLYISPKTEIVIAHFASSPGVSNLPFYRLYCEFHADIARLFL